jgi:opacity protein-like surface antigen
LSGTIGTADTSINEYQVSYTLQGCTANATDYILLNGVAFTGMGYLDFSTNPATLIYAVAGSSASGGDFGIVSNLTAP